MASVADVGFSFRRGEATPLDVSFVFNTIADLQGYLSSSTYLTPPDYTGLGFPYAGQVLAVLNGTSQPDVYVIWEAPSGTAGAVENQLNTLFYAYAQISAAPAGGGPMPEPPDDAQLYGRKRGVSAPTGSWELVADDGQY